MLVLPIPQKAAREVLEAWYFHQTWEEDGPRGPVFHQGSVGVVLEAWYYTRAAGKDVVHGAMTTAARGVNIQGADINIEVAW